MSKNISLDEIKKFWPDKAPDINIVQKYVKKYEKEKIVIKYGGNVLIDRNVFNNFISDINVLNRLGLSVVVVHGGGPRIKRELDKKKIVSKFINGLRVTDKNIIDTVEEVLIDFNKDIASSLKKLGSQAAMFHTKTDNVIEVEPEKLKMRSLQSEDEDLQTRIVNLYKYFDEDSFLQEISSKIDDLQINDRVDTDLEDNVGKKISFTLIDKFKIDDKNCKKLVFSEPVKLSNIDEGTTITLDLCKVNENYELTSINFQK